MKINEFIEKVNEHDGMRAKKVNHLKPWKRRPRTMENRIRECREKKKLTLKQLSEELAKHDFRISADALGKYERGDREPNLATWERLAKALHVSPAYLVGWSDKPNDD